MASYLSGVILLGFGVWFLATPETAMAEIGHSPDMLPYVMGGRYFFFGSMLIGALLYKDSIVLGTLLAGFAGMGLFDGALYWSIDPWPHLYVGVLALVAALYFFKTGKVAG